jgi:periplasmic protein TonB
MSAQLLEPPSYTQQAREKTDTLLVWLFIAAAVHAFVLLGISFVAPKSQAVSKAIEVTIVHTAAKKAPENAKYLAQQNQIAAGLENQKPLPMFKQTPQSGKHDNEQPEKTAAQYQPTVQHRLVTRKKAEQKIASAQQVLENQPEPEQSQQSQPEMSLEELDKQIALLELQLKQQKEASEKTRIKSVNAISAHQYLATAYIKAWEAKVERVGNLNYPEINGHKNFDASLSMDVGINTDGSIYNVVIVKSSGISELDKAAIRIVRSMIFDPLPPELTKELDVLRIRREWIFSNETVITTLETDSSDTDNSDDSMESDSVPE